MLDEMDNDRRGFLKCMAWAGTGALLAFDGGIGSSIGLDAALAAPVKRAATAMAVGTALQIGVSLTGKYLARQAGKQAVNAVVRPRGESKGARNSRAVAKPEPAQAAPVDPYPHAAAVSETVVVRRVWIRRG
jgi:hypothetical protein